MARMHLRYTAPMTNWRKQFTRLRPIREAAAATLMATIMVVIFAPAFHVRAQEQNPDQNQNQDQKPPDASDVAEGMRLFQQKGNCQSCHGWAGDGRNTDSQMPSGANLRETKLSRAGIVLTIKCGRLNAQMPAFDKFAYTDGRCYDKTKADLKSYPTRMPDPPATLQPREIDLIVDFLFAKVIGKGPMDHAKCVDFWGSETDACKEFPK
jgi:mono/diheme cytochrome c family protein